MYQNGNLGAVPKGYYDFVYRLADERERANEEFAGSLELNLAATDLNPASPDVIVSYDVIVSPDIRYVTSPEIRYIESPDDSGKGDGEDQPIGVRSSSSSGCNAGIGAMGIVMLAGIAFASKER